MTGGIIEIDLHGFRYEEALACVEKKVMSADKSVYRIRLIHGYHGGTALRKMAQEEFGWGRNPRVLRVENGANPGITELVLREY
ncbi:MAG TPA: hypothetical protein PLN48_08245 [Lachnospiraceae bacterium]|nr:hypothetical protein [Lachnospiraceae bacterium]